MLNKEEINLLNRIKNRTVYEEYFFKKRSETKWFDELKKRGYFKPNPNTQPQEIEKGYFMIPKWNVLSYLEKISKQVNVQGNERYIEELLKIIIEVSKYKNSDGHPIDNYRTWHSFVKIISNLPNSKISDNIIDLIPIWLSSKLDLTLVSAEIIKKLLPKFLTNNSEDIIKVEKIIKFLTSTKPSFSEGEEKITLVVDSYLLKEGFEKYSDDIGKKCSEKVIKDLEEKIKEIITNKEQGTYYSFYEELDYSDNPLDILTFILKRILISKARSDTETTKKILRDFLKDDYLYFVKMALYILGNVFEKYNDFFWEVLVSDVDNIIFKNSDAFGDELKHILENLKELNDEQKEILNKKIDDSAKLEDFRENQELMLKLHKQKYYNALSYDQYFNDQYKKLKDITNYDIELRPIIGKVEVGSVPNISPLSKEKILQMSNQDLAIFLSNFKDEEHWKGPSVNGLSKLLEEVARENPKKFTDDMTPFLKTGYLYVSDIIRGIRNAWEDNKIFSWNNLLEYIKGYIDREDFWNDKYIAKDDYRNANHFWVLGGIGELIKKGIIDDSRYLSEQNYPLVQEIIFLILDKLLLDKKEVLESKSGRKNIIQYTMNSVFGKITEVLLVLAYRIKKNETKANNKKQEIGWNYGIKDRYEILLTNEILESYVWLGMYLIIFYLLLDKKWTEGQIKKIYSAQEKIWEAFMQGYLYSNKIDKDIYKIMRLHYEKAIGYAFKEDYSFERLVQHICYMYLEGIEEINDKDGLFRKMLDRWDQSQIKEVISWFWMQRNFIMEPLDEKNNPEEKNRMESMRAKIIDFWRWIYKNKYKDKVQLSEKDKEILSELSKLTVFIKKIDSENYEWLKLSAPYIHVDFNASFFLKYLDGLKDKDENAGKYIGQLFIELLNNSTPDYDQRNICSIVEYLFIKGYIENAKKVCSIYGSRGHEFLRDIYEKYK